MAQLKYSTRTTDPYMEVTRSSSLGVQSVLDISKYGTETSKDSTKYVIHGGWQNGCSATIEGDGIGWRAGSVMFLNLAAQRALVMASKTKILSSPIKCDCPPAYLRQLRCVLVFSCTVWGACHIGLCLQATLPAGQEKFGDIWKISSSKLLY